MNKKATKGIPKPKATPKKTLKIKEGVSFMDILKLAATTPKKKKSS